MKVINLEKLRCPTCGSPMVHAKNIEGTDSTFWMVCSQPTCNTYVDTYIPQEHQYDVHKDSHKYIGVFGGYGSGKTQLTIKDDEKHMLSNPNGLTVVGSAVLSQVEQTYEKDFKKDFPAAFVVSHNATKGVYRLINGHEIYIKSFYDEELLRSMNATRVHIVEASAVDYEIFVQLQARLRNLIATSVAKDEFGNKIWDKANKQFLFKADWRRCFIESNPSVGWIRDNFLLNSDFINTKYSKQVYNVIDRNPNYSTHVFPTRLNKYVPADFESTLAKNKPMWWINRYLNGSFDYAEGMVYPNVMSCFINSFTVPSDWTRYMAMDYGINDPTAFIFGAIDNVNHILYIIGETYENNRNYKEQAAIYWEAHKVLVPNNNYYKTPVMDGRSINKRNDSNLKTIGDLFKEEGIIFKGAKMEIDARMIRLNTIIDSGRIKIFKDKCPNLYKEIINYKFPERTADGKSKGDKPVDKNNHATNALEFMCMELPVDMDIKDLYAYGGDGKMLIPDKYKNGSRINKSNSKKSKSNPYAIDIFKNVDEDNYEGFGKIFNNRGGIESW